MSATLGCHRNVAVLHLVSGIDCLIWILYFCDDDEKLRVETATIDGDEVDHLAHVLFALDEQLEADIVGDAARVADLEHTIADHGDQLGATLSPEMRRLIPRFDHVYYMPDPFGNIDEFPIDALRLDGEWFGDLVTITRSNSLTHLREALSPNRAPYRGNPNAAVVSGATDLGGERLAAVAREIRDRVR